MPLIEVDNVSKLYKARGGPRTLLAGGGAVNLFHRRKETLTALCDISFTVEHGEALGIIGANGSGKSTLLKLLAGVTVPTTGQVRVSGRVASLLELGAGFHPLLTGRENIYLNARILGVGRAQIERVFDKIVEFSGIEEFLDNPVNTYSSGMFVRLGFAVAVHTDPDIFLVDEVLSVGDEEFQRKCRTRIGELREQGKTLVFVSHDLSIVNTLCNRVILLSKGKMISRGTPRDTIDFYLRQIGREVGIHTFAQGDVEAIFCHGRISLFHKGREVTASRGLQMVLQCMGQWQESTAADWVVSKRSNDSCTARGRMSRLPLSLIWDLRLEGSRLIWRAAFDCEHEVNLSAIRADLFWPPAFATWFYDEKTGPFPSILGGDLTWTTVVSYDPNCRDAAALPEDGLELPPLQVRLDPHKPYLALAWSNSDYILGARVLQIIGPIPDKLSAFHTGLHEIMTVEVDLGLTADEIRLRAAAHEAECTIKAGRFSAVFDRGKVRCAWDGQEFTWLRHFYASVLIGNMWNDSLTFQWSASKRVDRGIVVTGESRRFPFAQYWELDPVENGMAVRIWLDAYEPLDIEEYHASIVLKADYDRWESEYESGVYPPFDPAQKDWRHLNRLYATGKRLHALTSVLPSIMLTVTTDDMPFRMTAINTGYFENGRVLQALRTPEAGILHFEKGRHLYFSGLITVTGDPSQASGHS